MKVLFVGNKLRNRHLEDFSHELRKNGVETKVIIDTDYLEKSLSINFQRKRNRKNQLKCVIEEFCPDFVVLDRISRIGEFLIDNKIPFVVLLRGKYWEEVKWAKIKNGRNRLGLTSINRNQKLADRIFSNARVILPISNYLKNEVMNRYPDKNIELLYADGRNLSEWELHSVNYLKHPCVGLVQGLNIWGKTNELKTLVNVMKKTPNVTFYLAGDGEYSNKIIPELETQTNFVWLGNLSYPKKIMEFFSEIDIFLLLSGLEGLGQSIIEAMIMKKPIIATSVGGIPELIKDGETGYLVEIGDDEKIKFAINEIFTKPEIKTKFIENVERESYKFGWENVAREFLDIIERYKY